MNDNMLDCVSRDKNRIENAFLIKVAHNNVIGHFHIFCASLYLEYRSNKSKIILYTCSVLLHPFINRKYMIIHFILVDSFIR